MNAQLRHAADHPVPSRWREVAPGQWIKDLDEHVTAVLVARTVFDRLTKICEEKDEEITRVGQVVLPRGNSR